MNQIFGFMKEGNGELSSVRLYSFVTILCMTTDWMHAIFTVGKWQPDIALIGLVLGTITAKVAQKPFEQKGSL